MTLPMLRILPSPWDFKMTTPGRSSSDSDDSLRDRYEPLRKLSMVQVQPPRNPNKPFTSFRISDILSATERKQQQQQQQQNNSAAKKLSTLSQRHHHQQHHNHHHHHPHDALSKLDNGSNRRVHNSKHVNVQRHNNNNNNHRVATASRIVRPWDTSPSPGRNSDASSDADDEEINVDEDDEEPISSSALKDVSPLDALMEMANKTFQGLETSEAADAKRREQAALFGKHSAPKKRRKSRTAFTNQQIYELEKRFLYQKYLTPADRDEIAQHLGLSNAQVITWFQNRRAKLKRDLEELKNDVVATKHHSIRSGTSDHEFDIDSDTDSVAMAQHTPQKRYRSESQSPVAENSSDSPKSMKSSQELSEDRCESPGEIVVDDKEENIEEKTS